MWGTPLPVNCRKRAMLLVRYRPQWFCYKWFSVKPTSPIQPYQNHRSNNRANGGRRNAHPVHDLAKFDWQSIRAIEDSRYGRILFVIYDTTVTLRRQTGHRTGLLAESLLNATPLNRNKSGSIVIDTRQLLIILI